MLLWRGLKVMQRPIPDSSCRITERALCRARHASSIESSPAPSTSDAVTRTSPHIGGLVIRYASLPLGFSDAAVVACAECTGGQVLTFDRRDFVVVAREATITLV